jgi:hypothetical protein
VKVDFLQTADDEFAEAIAYYNLQSEGLEFAAEVKRTRGRILHDPNAWTSLSKGTRRCRLSRVAYALLYQIRGQLIRIVAEPAQAPRFKEVSPEGR